MDEITTTTASVDEYDEELDLSIQKQIDALTLEEEEEDEEDEEELEELEDDDEDDDEDDEKLAKDNNQTNAQAIVACAYCGISNPSCVVKCKKTQKWFCNSKTGALPASCIVFHLVKSRSNAIVLHPESP